MSQATHGEPQEESNKRQRLLSHLAAHLFTEVGGAVGIETLHLRATDYLELDEKDVQAAIEDGEDEDIYVVERGRGNGKQITDVNPVGSPPEALGEIEGFDIPTDTGSTDFSELRAVGESLSKSIQDAGCKTFGALYNADPEDLTDISTVTYSKAELIIDQAGQHVPSEEKIAFEAVERYQRHVDEHDTQSAVVQSILNVPEDVGDLLANDDTIPPDEMHYKGLPKLRDRGHPHLVSDNEFPQRDGTPIPPKTTDIDHVGINTLEATTQKLGRGNMGLRLVGPHGCGKNYLLRYLHWKTNRVLVSVDADSSMLAQDVLGISTVNEDRVNVFRDGVLTKSMKHGYTIVINEGNVVPAGVMMALQKILNQNVLTVKESGEEIIPHPAARVVITMNPPVREYRDSEPLNAATRDRFQTIYFDYLNSDDEVNLLDQMANADRLRIDREDIKRLVEFASSSRDNETWPTVSTRKLEHAIDWIDEGASVRGALKHVVKAAAEPHQHPADTHEKIEDL
jgi:nitric oxide reductase NorQ protein